MLMAITVIAIVLLLTVAVILYKRKKEAEQKRMQEEELEAFLNLGDGAYGWQNVRKHQAAASSGSVPVIHMQAGGSNQAPDQANPLPVETPAQQMHRFR